MPRRSHSSINRHNARVRLAAHIQALTAIQAECASLLPAEEIAEMERVIAGEAVVLYGWSGCPCTSIARTRFTGEGVRPSATQNTVAPAQPFKRLLLPHRRALVAAA